MVSDNLRFVITYGGPAVEALADPTRRAIFELLGLGPRSVVDIASEVPVSRPAVSQHLKVLKEHFWTTALAAYARAVEDAVEDTAEEDD
jgi:DNA-binding transcriptional ArsR family regulator